MTVNNELLKTQQIYKDANLAFILSLISIPMCIIPIFGIVLALSAERIAHKLPFLEDTQTKINLTHVISSIGVILSIIVAVLFYIAWDVGY